jgi:hypothetical protein
MATTDTGRPVVPAPRPASDPAAASADSTQWCVVCGFAHDPDTHCPECSGVHQGGFCLTEEAIAELGRRDALAAQLEAAAPRIIDAHDYPRGGQ